MGGIALGKKYSKKEPNVYRYTKNTGEQLWGYRYKYYDALNRRREVKRHGFSSENDAIRSLLQIKVEAMEQSYTSIESNDLTIRNWFDIWFETNQSHWARTTVKQREIFLKKALYPLLGNKKIKNLTKSQYINQFINPLKTKYSHSTLTLYHRLFKIGINAAVDEEILPRNRFNSIVIPEYDLNKPNNFLTAEQLKIFLEIAKETENITNYTMILTLAYTGLRRGELYGLKWKDINLNDRTLSVRATRDNKGYRKPKTKNSIRTIYLDEIVTEQLRKYKIWCRELLLPERKKVTPTSFVFISHQTARPVTDGAILYAIRRVSEKSGVGVGYLTPHGLRHTHATILVSQSVPLQTIAARLGNTPEMILNIYGHSYDELEQKSVQLFSDALEN